MPAARFSIAMMIFNLFAKLWALWGYVASCVRRAGTRERERVGPRVDGTADDSYLSAPPPSPRSSAHLWGSLGGAAAMEADAPQSMMDSGYTSLPDLGTGRTAGGVYSGGYAAPPVTSDHAAQDGTVRAEV